MDPGMTKPMNYEQFDFWKQQLNMEKLKPSESTYGGQAKFYGDAVLGDFNTKINLSDGELIANPKDGSLFKYNMGPDGKMYLQATFTSGNDSYSFADSGILGTGLMQQYKPELKNRIQNVDIGFGSNPAVTVNIPVDEFWGIEEYRMKANVNPAFKTRTDVTNAAVDYTQGAENAEANELMQYYQQFQGQ